MKKFRVYILVDYSKELPTVVPDNTPETETIKKEWAEFYYWSWGDFQKILQEAKVIDPATGDTRIDNLKLREGKIKYLLCDWSLVDEKGNKLELKRNKDGLTKEGLELVDSVSAPIILGFLAKADLVLEFGKKEEDFFTENTLNTSTNSNIQQK